MTAAIRDSDKRLIEGASRLRLPWIREHMTEMLEWVLQGNMARFSPKVEHLATDIAHH